MKDTVEIDTLIIGGGVIGLTTAYEYNKKFPEKFVAIIDGAPYLGDHTTGRNSGVMHSGIYYDTNSLKHQMCIQGNEIWKTLSTELNIPYKKCGKYIIACNEEEAKEISQILLKATKNNVKDFRKMTTEEIKEVSQITNAIDGLYFNNTGILDASESIKALEKYLFNKDIPILLNTSAKEITKENDNFRIETNNEIIICKNLFNCAGHGSIKVRRMLGFNELSEYLVKGNYLKYTKKINTNKLIYPVPLKNLKGLGVHLTFDFQNEIKFGPDTEDVNEIDYSVSKETKPRMINSIKRIFKNIDNNFLTEDYCGIRPKILLNGELYKDFWIKTPNEHGLEGYFETCGIESPGLTSAPAIAKYLMGNLAK